MNAVVEQEWPLMRDGKESTVAWADIDGIFDAMQSYRPDDHGPGRRSTTTPSGI